MSDGAQLELWAFGRQRTSAHFCHGRIHGHITSAMRGPAMKSWSISVSGDDEICAITSRCIGPTVYRLSQTFMDGGHTGHGTGEGRFYLKLKVRDLSEGFADGRWISSVVAPAQLRKS
jgi:hypothetical protein